MKLCIFVLVGKLPVARISRFISLSSHTHKTNTKRMGCTYVCMRV